MEKHAGEEEIFDITFNRAEFSTENITDFIMTVIEKKEILKEYRNKIPFF